MSKIRKKKLETTADIIGRLSPEQDRAFRDALAARQDLIRKTRELDEVRAQTNDKVVAAFKSGIPALVLAETLDYTGSRVYQMIDEAR